MVDQKDAEHVLVVESYTLYTGYSWVDVGSEQGRKVWPNEYAALYARELNRLWKERGE